MKIKPLIKESYMAVIKNSVGTKMFQNFYAQVNGEKKDIVNDGELSCAFFISSVLNNFKLIKEPHLTVKSTIKDMARSGWEEINKPEIGSVLLWKKRDKNKHLGFYIGGEKAISTIPEEKTPVIHDWKYRDSKEGEREIKKIYWHKKLDE